MSSAPAIAISKQAAGSDATDRGSFAKTLSTTCERHGVDIHGRKSSSAKQKDSSVPAKNIENTSATSDSSTRQAASDSPKANVFGFLSPSIVLNAPAAAEGDGHIEQPETEGGSLKPGASNNPKAGGPEADRVAKSETASPLDTVTPVAQPAGPDISATPSNLPVTSSTSGAAESSSQTSNGRNSASNTNDLLQTADANADVSLRASQPDQQAFTLTVASAQPKQDSQTADGNASVPPIASAPFISAQRALNVTEQQKRSADPLPSIGQPTAVHAASVPAQFGTDPAAPTSQAPKAAETQLHTNTEYVENKLAGSEQSGGSFSNVRLQLHGESNERVSVGLFQENSGLRVTVRSSDPALTQSLQDRMPELTTRLEQQHFQTEVSIPGKAHEGQNTHANVNVPYQDSGSGGYPDSSGGRRSTYASEEEEKKSNDSDTDQSFSTLLGLVG